MAASMRARFRDSKSPDEEKERLGEERVRSVGVGLGKRLGRVWLGRVRKRVRVGKVYHNNTVKREGV